MPRPAAAGGQSSQRSTLPGGLPDSRSTEPSIRLWAFGRLAKGKQTSRGSSPKRSNSPGRSRGVSAFGQQWVDRSELEGDRVAIWAVGLPPGIQSWCPQPGVLEMVMVMVMAVAGRREGVSKIVSRSGTAGESD